MPSMGNTHIWSFSTRSLSCLPKVLSPVPSTSAATKVKVILTGYFFITPTHDSIPFCYYLHCSLKANSPVRPCKTW